MAHSLSSKKRIRQNQRRRKINRARKSALKTQTRKFADAVTAKDVSTAEAEFKKLTKDIDRTRAKGVIHPNQAARRKSRPHKRLNALNAASL